MDASETERLTAARNGNRPAFDFLCQTYRQEMYSLCYRFLNNADDTQDVVQEVFARAWQSLGTYRGEASFRTWLWEIGRNLCLNQLRARKSLLNQHTVSMDSSPDGQKQQPFEVADTRATPEEVALDAAHRAEIRAEIAECAAAKKWDAKDWELFLLRLERNITYAEFAQRHGRDEAYWRNRWRDKIKPVLERVRENMSRSSV